MLRNLLVRKLIKLSCFQPFNLFVNTQSILKKPHSCFRLYNKDAVIEYLLDKTAERPNAEAVTHIRGIKV